MTAIVSRPQCVLNSLWPNDTIWRQRSGSTLAQVMACCLTAPSNHLNQCRHIIKDLKIPINKTRLKIEFLKSHPHYNDVIMDAIPSQITSLTIVYSMVYSGADQRKHQSSALLAFVRGIHRWPVNSPHKWLVTRKIFSFDDVIIKSPRGQWVKMRLGRTSILHCKINPGYWRLYKCQCSMWSLAQTIAPRFLLFQDIV